MFNWIRMQIDKILLSDHEWKKKYCPTLYNYLFKMSPEERNKEWEELVERDKVVWEKRFATMTDEEIEVEYGLGTIYISDSTRDKRRKEEQEILKGRGY